MHARVMSANSAVKPYCDVNAADLKAADVQTRVVLLTSSLYGHECRLVWTSFAVKKFASPSACPRLVARGARIRGGIAPYLHCAR